MQVSLIQNHLGNAFRFDPAMEEGPRNKAQGSPNQTLASMMARSDKAAGFPDVGQWTEGQGQGPSHDISLN